MRATHINNTRVFALGLCLALGPACGDDGSSDGGSGDGGSGDGGGDGGDLEIVGEYTDDFETAHSITDADWTQDYMGDVSVFHIEEFDNTEAFVIGENDADNAFNPGDFSRFDWTFDDAGDLWFCQVIFDAASVDAARKSGPADASDPAMGGCSDFPWSKLTAQ